MEKGFTLIELLAVILILGIIALIAIPTVNNIIEEAKVGTFKNNISNVEKAIIRKCETELLKGSILTKKYVFNNKISTEPIDVKGELPNDGVIYVNNDCDVKLYLSNGKIGITKDYIDDEYTLYDKNNINKLLEKYNNGTLVYFNPTTGNICSEIDDVQIGTGKYSGCMRWYIINDEVGNDTVDMILEHNTHALKTYNMALTIINTMEWVSGLNQRMPSLDEIEKVAYKGIFDLNVSGEDGYSIYAYIYNYTASWKGNCIDNGCRYYDDTSGSYWVSSNDEKYISENRMPIIGSVRSSSVVGGGGIGVRPVITISKTLISNN